MAKIVLVEDNEDLAMIVADGLEAERHTVEVFHNGLDGFERLKQTEFDVIILDWDLPGKNGLEILKSFRAGGGQTPIIMLTGKSEIEEKEQGLDSGADDYMTKPFETRELCARIRSMLRRPPQTTSHNVVQAHDLVLDPAKFRVTKNGAEVRLQPRDFALLEFLMRHPNEIFNAEVLIDRVWNYDSDATPQSLRVAIARIRRAVDGDEDVSNSVIENVARVGYRLRPRD